MIYPSQPIDYVAPIVVSHSSNAYRSISYSMHCLASAQLNFQHISVESSLRVFPSAGSFRFVFFYSYFCPYINAFDQSPSPLSPPQPYMAKSIHVICTTRRRTRSALIDKRREMQKYMRSRAKYMWPTTTCGPMFEKKQLRRTHFNHRSGGIKSFLFTIIRQIGWGFACALPSSGAMAK